MRRAAHPHRVTSTRTNESRGPSPNLTPGVCPVPSRGGWRNRRWQQSTSQMPAKVVPSAAARKRVRLARANVAVRGHCRLRKMACGAHAECSNVESWTGAPRLRRCSCGTARWPRSSPRAIAVWPGALLARPASPPARATPNGTPAKLELRHAQGHERAGRAAGRLRGQAPDPQFLGDVVRPARTRFPALVALSQKYKDKGLTVLGISVDDSPEELQKFAAEYTMNYPVLVGSATTTCSRPTKRRSRCPSPGSSSRTARSYLKHRARRRSEWFEQQVTRALLDPMSRRRTPPVDPPLTAQARRAAARRRSAPASRAAPSPSCLRARPRPARCPIHVGGLPIYDHREALRPATRLAPPPQPDYETKARQPRCLRIARGYPPRAAGDPTRPAPVACAAVRCAGPRCRPSK